MDGGELSWWVQAQHGDSSRFYAEVSKQQARIRREGSAFDLHLHRLTRRQRERLKACEE